MMESFMPICDNIHEIKKLLDTGMNINTLDTRNGMALLHFAASYGRLDIIKYFLDSGADVNVFDRFMDTPLNFAAWRGFSGIVQYLLENGADKDKVNDRGGTAVGIANSLGHTDIAS